MGSGKEESEKVPWFLVYFPQFFSGVVPAVVTEPVEFEVYSNLLMLDEERARLESELRKTGKSDFIIGNQV